MSSTHICFTVSDLLSPILIIGLSTVSSYRKTPLLFDSSIDCEHLCIPVFFVSRSQAVINNKESRRYLILSGVSKRLPTTFRYLRRQGNQNSWRWAYIL